MRQYQCVLRFETTRQGLMEITDRVSDALTEAEIGTGLCTLFCRHTSASLLIQENAAPAARADLERYFARVAPESSDYAHDEEGADDMPAHLRSALTDVQLTIPIIGGTLALGTWQGIYLFEHRRRPHRREIVRHVLGD